MAISSPASPVHLLAPAWRASITACRSRSTSASSSGAAGVADDLTEDVAEQPDVAAHRLGEGSPVPIAGPLHGSVHG